jgi:hypothetical protein
MVSGDAGLQLQAPAPIDAGSVAEWFALKNSPKEPYQAIAEAARDEND